MLLPFVVIDCLARIEQPAVCLAVLDGQPGRAWAHADSSSTLVQHFEINFVIGDDAVAGGAAIASLVFPEPVVINKLVGGQAEIFKCEHCAHVDPGIGCEKWCSEWTVTRSRAHSSTVVYACTAHMAASCRQLHSRGLRFASVPPQCSALQCQACSSGGCKQPPSPPVPAQPPSTPGGHADISLSLLTVEAVKWQQRASIVQKALQHQLVSHQSVGELPVHTTLRYMHTFSHPVA